MSIHPDALDGPADPRIEQAREMAEGGGLKDDPNVWLLWYYDQDRRVEIFSGCGATHAAHRRFDMQRSAWSCALFKMMERSPP